VTFSVRLTADAALDLEEIGSFISIHDSPGRAEAVVEKIGQAVDSLTKNPHRGAHPPEGMELGDRQCREIFFKPYRIIYQVTGQAVLILLIGDGRRNMRELLRRRLQDA